MISIINATYDDYIPNWYNPEAIVKCHILVLVTDGSLNYRLDGKLLQASKGDLVYIPIYTKREAFNSAHELHQKFAILFDFSETFGLPLLEQKKVRIFQIRALDFLKERFKTLFKQTLEQSACYQTITKGILLEILGYAQRELETPPLPFRKVQAAEKIEHFLVEHYRQSVSLDMLACHIQKSPNYTLALFKEVYGLTPHEYLHQLRIHVAMDLLENTKLTVAAVAEHLGYYDTSAFYKMFLKKTGQTPSEFRAQRRLPLQLDLQ